MISWGDLFEWSRNWADGSSLPVLVPLHLLYSFASLLELVIWRDGWLSNTAEAYGLLVNLFIRLGPRSSSLSIHDDSTTTELGTVCSSSKSGCRLFVSASKVLTKFTFCSSKSNRERDGWIGRKKELEEEEKKNWQKAHTRMCRGSRSEQHRCLLINRLYTFFFPRELKRQKGPRVSETERERERWGGPIDSIIFPVYQSTFGAVTYWLSIHA